MILRFEFVLLIVCMGPSLKVGRRGRSFALASFSVSFSSHRRSGTGDVFFLEWSHDTPGAATDIGVDMMLIWKVGHVLNAGRG